MHKILFFSCLCVLGCGFAERSSPSQILPVKQVIMEGLNHPWSIDFISAEEALVSEKDGNLLRVNLATKQKTVIQNLPEDLVDSLRVRFRGDNSGLFEIRLHPDFAQNQYVYLAYAAKQGGGMTTKVIRAKLVDDALREAQTILEASPYTREYFHYGGGMCFGEDGKLYITVGERLFREIDSPPLPIAQDVRDKRGKIYRLNDDGSIPDDNPDFGSDAVPGLFAMGIRAAQGICVRPGTGEIWFSEHGTIHGDEINLLQAGANYGWPIITTGRYRSEDFEPPFIEGAEYTDPIWFWKQTVAPTGLCFYNGPDFPLWQGNLLVPGLSTGSLWRIRLEGQKIKSLEMLFADDPVRARKVAQAPDGKLYLLTDEDNGKIVRIAPDSDRVSD
ncbi:MAG: PQQ-dependent sugar dehydrogenase [Bacteroidota bacterium]